MKTTNQPTFQLPDDASAGSGQDKNEAADLIRSKLDRLYNQEPDPVTETIEAEQAAPKSRSKHQKFMHELATSGKPFAMIQLEWHNYYKALPDKEKHEVWEEFYAVQGQQPAFGTPIEQPAHKTHHKLPDQGFAASFEPEPATKPKASRSQSVADMKRQITGRVHSRGKLSRKQHLKSLIFGLSMGGIVVIVLLFGLFNQMIIAPFITPSRNVSATPIITDPSGTTVGSEDKIIIPKINVEVPVVYDVQSVEEHAVQEGLERGVVHYATTSNPGEQGNGAIFGHSSNNILNKGKYKFAFVLLSRLEKDDTFYIEKGGVRYVYKIFDKKVVSPNEVSVLSSIPGKANTMALITCDPPGTTVNRLVVWGEQVSPDPTSNVASTAIQTEAQATTLAGNAESLWSRIWNSIF